MVRENSGCAIAPISPTAIKVPTLSRLDRAAFPDPASGGKLLPATLENVEHLMRETGFTVNFDEVRKDVCFLRHGKRAQLSALVSEANRYGMPTGQLTYFVGDIARINPVNPVREWIRKKPWDGRDRLPDIRATLRVSEAYPQASADILLDRWLTACVAAVTVSPFRTRGVFTLLGPQGTGKTSWFRSLVNDRALQAEVVKIDHHLDCHNKDSILGAIKSWIVELGEVDGMMRKDVARMKGVLTRDRDTIRPPYARSEEGFPRTTVFGASVNRTDFLNDPTGNSRFWVVEVDEIDYNHGIDMQQLFAQLDVAVQAGKRWWLNAAEEAMLTAQNERYKSISPIAERLLEVFDLERSNGEEGKFFNASGALREAGLSNPTTGQSREAGAFLRQRLGQSRRRNGYDGWLLVAANAPKPGQPKLNPEDEY